MLCISITLLFLYKYFDVGYKFKISRPKYLFLWCFFFNYKMGSKKGYMEMAGLFRLEIDMKCAGLLYYTLLSMKGTHLNRPHDLWLYDILTDEKSMWQLLQKFLCINFDRKKKNIIYLFLRFKIYMTNAASWNELSYYVARGFLPRMADQRKVKLFSSIIFFISLF